jgi:hypothetical protein
MTSWLGILPAIMAAEISLPSSLSRLTLVPLTVSTDLSTTFTSRSTDTKECPVGSAERTAAASPSDKWSTADDEDGEEDDAIGIVRSRPTDHRGKNFIVSHARAAVYNRIEQKLRIGLVFQAESSQSGTCSNPILMNSDFRICYCFLLLFSKFCNQGCQVFRTTFGQMDLRIRPESATFFYFKKCLQSNICTPKNTRFGAI